VVWLGALMLGLGNFCVVMLTRSQFYEVPISSAYAFSCTSLLLFDQALMAGAHRRRWLWLASSAFGLAIASRPHFVFASVVLGIVWIYLWREYGRGWPEGRRRRLIGDTMALGLPLALTLLGLFAYNFERFDSPFEFGQKYQLAGSNEMHMALLARSSLPVNLYYYFWAPAQFGRFFPFVDIVARYPGKLPGNYYGIEDPFGLMTNMPCFWLAGAAPVLWLACYRRLRVLGWMLLLCGACFTAVCVFTLFFVSATNRYMVDFLPALLLIAAVGLLMISAPRGAPWRGFLLQGFASALILYTAFFNAMAAFQHNGLFQHLRPAAYDRIARWFNRPVGVLDGLEGHRYGPVEMLLKFPSGALGRSEPLVVTGRGLHADLVNLYYTDGGSIQIGFTHLGSAVSVQTQPIALDYAVPHRVGIATGSLYPPSTHPFFAHWPAEAVRAAKQTLVITVDGVPYLDVPQSFYESSPGVVAFGENPLSDYGGRKFSGELLGIRRGPLPPALERSAGGGFVRLAFVFPSALAGLREPLVATGTGGVGDVVFFVGEDDTHVRLGFQHAGTDALLSEPLSIVPGRIQLLEASLGSFYPISPKFGDLSKALIVKFNNRLVWAQEGVFSPAGAPEFGVNVWRSASCGSAFTGKIVAAQPMPSPLGDASAAPFAFRPYWVEAGAGSGYGALRLRLDLPRGRAGPYEPLLVSGPSVAQADYVWIQYLDAARIQLGYEHTSGGGPLSGAIPMDFGRSHTFEIDVPSLYPAQDDGYFATWPLLSAFAAKSRARIRVDGTMWIDVPVKAYESSPAQATVGENRLSNTFGRRFTGQIIQVERAVHGPPPGFGDQTGPLRMTLTWPKILPVGRREGLLATGDGDARDALEVSYEDAEHARLIVQSHDGKSLVSALWRIIAGGSASLSIGWGGFFPEHARPASTATEVWHARQKSFAIEMEGAPAFEGSVDFILKDPQGVSIGAVGASSDAFSGLLHDIRRLPGKTP
jgi:hypothetical protein